MKMPERLSVRFTVHPWWRRPWSMTLPIARMRIADCRGATVRLSVSMVWWFPIAAWAIRFAAAVRAVRSVDVEAVP